MFTPSTDDYAPAAQFYDYVPFYRDRADVAFYVEEAVKANGPVLELARGSGRVLLPTARAGISIVGLDASSEMLSRCRSSLRQEMAVPVRDLRHVIWCGVHVDSRFGLRSL